MRATSPISRLLANVEIVDGCWEWRTINDQGYGIITERGKRHRAHRVTYEWVNGPIPEGLDIDHLCRNRACCNPNHLEAVTRSVNLKRGWDVRPRSTHCKQGHELTPDNLVPSSKTRRCLTCHRASCRAYQARLRAAYRQMKNNQGESNE